MQPLTPSDLLDVWERGLTQGAIQRALLLLAVAFPEMSPETLAELSIGQRDAHLLTLRTWTFGPHLTSLAVCPHCGERLELKFNVSDIQVKPEVEPAEPLSFQVDAYKVRFRLPNSLDLAALAAQVDISASRQHVLDRCLLTAHKQGQQTSLDQLPDEIKAAVIAEMAAADPQAEVRLTLTCPACCHQWQTLFDIVSFFWSEINAWACRILRDVHTLAYSYGWSQADILAMSPRRRQFYLAMISRT